MTNNKELKEIVELEGRVGILSNGKRVPINFIKKIPVVYNVKAHYRDEELWEEGERERVKRIPGSLMKRFGIDANFFHFGTRKVYIDGVTVTTIGGNWFDEVSDDHGFQQCEGECKGHDYVRDVSFYKQQRS